MFYYFLILVKDINVFGVFGNSIKKLLFIFFFYGIFVYVFFLVILMEIMVLKYFFNFCSKILYSIYEGIDVFIENIVFNRRK